MKGYLFFFNSVQYLFYLIQLYNINLILNIKIFI